MREFLEYQFIFLDDICQQKSFAELLIHNLIRDNISCSIVYEDIVIPFLLLPVKVHTTKKGESRCELVVFCIDLDLFYWIDRFYDKDGKVHV